MNRPSRTLSVKEDILKKHGFFVKKIPFVEYYHIEEISVEILETKTYKHDVTADYVVIEINGGPFPRCSGAPERG